MDQLGTDQILRHKDTGFLYLGKQLRKLTCVNVNPKQFRYISLGENETKVYLYFVSFRFNNENISIQNILKIVRKICSRYKRVIQHGLYSRLNFLFNKNNKIQQNMNCNVKTSISSPLNIQICVFKHLNIQIKHSVGKC